MNKEKTQRIRELFLKGSWLWVGRGKDFMGELWVLDVTSAREISDLLSLGISDADTE